MQDSETELDKIFLSYNKILKRLNNQGYKTKSGKEIKHKDLCYAIDFMIKKHPYCRWRSEKINSKRYYILIEGYYWLIKVFFQNEKKLIDADINFFEIELPAHTPFLYAICAGGAAFFAFNAIALFVKWKIVRLC